MARPALSSKVAHELCNSGEWTVLWAGPSSAAEVLETESSRLGAAIGEQPALLMLDGHDLPSRHGEVQLTLLDDYPKLLVVVTVRRPLRAAGWRVLPLAPLRVPAETDDAHLERSEAVRLLVRLLEHAYAGFRLDPENRTLIAEICRQVDALPAALEAVAQWSVTHSLEEILDELSRDPAALSFWHGPSDRREGITEVFQQAAGRLDPRPESC